MKSQLTIVIIALLGAFVSCTHPVEHLAMLNAFNEWKLQYGKVYSTVEEESERFTIFADNYRFINEYNAAGNTAVLGINQFADLTSEEFGEQMGCITDEQKAFLQNLPTVQLDVSDIPTAVNWTAQGAVTGVKNQGQCGGCWAYAAAASLESFNFIKNKNLVDLSAQQLIDCVPTCDGCGGCDNLYNALVYTSQYGIESQDSYTGNGQCAYDSSKVVVKNEGYAAVTPNSVDQLKAAIAQQPVEVGIQADQSVFQFYRAGVISGLCGKNVDHAVTAVGYGSINGQDAFIIKNSWGANWGVNGYVFISTNPKANGGAGVCGVLTMPVYPTQV